jgi:hypothetical protein
MGKRGLSILVALTLAMPVSTNAVASKSPKLAKCDGKKRRPANPYGSILPTVDPQNGTSTPAEQKSGRTGVDVFPQTPPSATKPATQDGKPATQVPPISSLNAPTAYRTC